MTRNGIIRSTLSAGVVRRDGGTLCPAGDGAVSIPMLPRVAGVHSRVPGHRIGRGVSPANHGLERPRGAGRGHQPGVGVGEPGGRRAVRAARVVRAVPSSLARGLL